MSTDQVSITTYNCFANEKNNNLNQSADLVRPVNTRIRDCIQRVASLKSDVVCVQGLSADHADQFLRGMTLNGYQGVYEQFDSKPDGIATFYLHSKFKEASKEVLSYEDGHGKKALFLHLTTHAGALLDVANTQLQEGGKQNQAVVCLEIQKLTAKVGQATHPTLVCGSLNFTPLDPRFTLMENHLSDSLEGQRVPTTKQGTNRLRLDYIWHPKSLKPARARVDGSFKPFKKNGSVVPQEPSNHLPVIASFNIPLPSAIQPLQNSSDADSAISLQKTLNQAFKQAKELWNQQQGEFTPLLHREIACLARDVKELSALLTLLPSSFVNPVLRHPYYNNQPSHSNSPSLLWDLFDQFNATYRSQLPHLPDIYMALAPLFSTLLTDADQLSKSQQNPDLLAILTNLIQTRIPTGFVQELFLKAIEPETRVILTCENVPSGQDLYIRGDQAGLSWSCGVKLERRDWKTFVFRTKRPFTKEMEFKLLLNDDHTRWEEGPNHKVSCQEKLSLTPNFASIQQKTVIEITFPTTAGKNLYISGNGPLGNWDQKIPLISADNHKHFLDLDGSFPDFEYKIRLDEAWESGENRKSRCGEKQVISSLSF